MRKITLTIMLFLCVAIYSQSGFTDGYIINQSGDTVSGLINNKDWINCPAFIEFKSDNSSGTVILKPEQIKLFEVSGKRYLSAVVEVENSNTTVDLTEFNDGQLHYKDTVFLKVILEGDWGLYEYAEQGTIKCFYYRDKNTYQLLQYSRYMVRKEPRDGGITMVYGEVKENREYIGQLVYLFKDFPVNQGKKQQIDYRAKDLQNLFLDYYNFTNNEPEYVLDLPLAKHYFGVKAGVVFSNINFRQSEHKDSELTYFSTVNYPVVADYSAGIFHEVNFPGNNEKHSILNELNISGYSAESYDDSNLELIYRSSLNISYIKYQFLYRDNHLLNLQDVFINAGLSCGVLVQDDNRFLVEAKEDARPAASLRELEESIDLQRIELGIHAGIGYRVNNFSFECRYEMGTGLFSAKFPIHDTSNQLYATLSYRL